MPLYERLSLFSNVSRNHKNQILLSSTYNDTRVITEDTPLRLELVRKIKKDAGKINVGEPNYSNSVREENWEADILAASDYFSSYTQEKILSSFILNNWLASQGLCPFARYAFSKWYDLKSEADVRLLAELSPFYLYKLVPQEKKLLESASEFIGSGAYGDVYLSEDRKTVIKYPKNLAAQAFVVAQEVACYEIAKEVSTFAKYLPEIFSYDEKTAILKKEYISGTSGWKLLEDDSFRRLPHDLGQIEDIYTHACRIYGQTGINIDIHPGNFQWSDDKAQWYLIECGSTPEIGADYFPRNNFKAYFQKIWLDLHRLMIEVPILSLDIDMPKSIHSNNTRQKQQKCTYRP